jgi:hypothetical protein
MTGQGTLTEGEGFDLLALTSLVWLFLILQTLFTFLQNKTP